MKIKTLLLICLFALTSISGKPELTEGIVIKISTTTNQPEREVKQTLKVLVKRLSQIGEYYGKKQITRLNKEENTYSIKFPQTSNIESLTRIIVNTGDLEFRETQDAYQLPSDLTAMIDSLLPPNFNHFKIRKAIFGLYHLADTMKINNTLNSLKDTLSQQISFTWGAKPFEASKDLYALYSLKKSHNSNENIILGKNIIKAKAYQSEYDPSYWNISFKMDKKAAVKWAEITKNNIGRTIAIVLNGKVYSTPTIMNQIKGGACLISGSFSETEAIEIATILKGGSLPTKVKIVNTEKPTKSPNLE